MSLCELDATYSIFVLFLCLLCFSLFLLSRYEYFLPQMMCVVCISSTRFRIALRSASPNPEFVCHPAS